MSKFLGGAVKKRHILALAAVVGLAGCTGANADRSEPVPARQSPNIERPDPKHYYCPESGSEEAKLAKPSPYRLDSNTSDDILVIGGGATVRVVGEASTTGLIRVCGGGATLVLDASHPNLRAYISGGGARVIIIDPEPSATYFDPGKVVLDGGGAEVITCGIKKLDIRSCSAYQL